MRIPVEKLTQDAFEAFGKTLGQPATGNPDIVDAVSNVWLSISDLMGIGTTPGNQITFLKILKRPERYDVIEKHDTSAEIFIPLEGQSILLVVPAEAVDADGQPDMQQARAFLMDGSQAVLLRYSTWHAVPYNLTDVATYLVLVDDAIIEKNDIHKITIEPVEFVFAGVTS